MISGDAGTVTLEDAHSAWPPPAMSSAREVSDRKTRNSSSGAAKTISVVRRFSGSEVSIRGSIPHLLQSHHDILNDLHEADPPEVSVQYMGKTFDALLTVYDPRPDAFEPTEYQAEFELRRVSS